MDVEGKHGKLLSDEIDGCTAFVFAANSDRAVPSRTSLRRHFMKHLSKFRNENGRTNGLDHGRDIHVVGHGVWETPLFR